MVKSVKYREGNAKVLNNKQTNLLSKSVLQPVGYRLKFHLSRLTLTCCKGGLKKRACSETVAAGVARCISSLVQRMLAQHRYVLQRFT